MNSLQKWFFSFLLSPWSSQRLNVDCLESLCLIFRDEHCEIELFTINEVQNIIDGLVLLMQPFSPLKEDKRNYDPLRNYVRLVVFLS